MENKHQKHESLTRPNVGEWGRNELSILGTTCDDIKQLVYKIIQSLPSLQIGFADADHKAANANGQSASAMDTGMYAEYTNKISYTQININTQPDAFYKRALLNNCDLVLVNGNHFTASKQIAVIDDRKPLEKKTEKLTNVQLILLKNLSSPIPDYISQHIPHFSSVPVLSFDDTEAIIHHIKTLVDTQTPPINGLVLAGGKSTRMGTDKGSIHYYVNTQREYLFNMLLPVCSEVFVSLNGQQVKEENKLPYIQDAFIGLGPAGGILSAFQQNPNSAWLTVACDLPFVTTELIAYLIAHRNPYKMATAFMDAGNKFPEPLVTIWEPKAYPALLQFLSEGYACPRKALINSDVELLHAPDASAFTNVNTPEDYEKVKRSLQQQA